MKTWHWLLGGATALGLFAWWKVGSLKNFAKYLVVTPKLDGNLKSISVKSLNVNIPLAVDFQNSSDTSATVSLPALQLSYKGKLVADIKPNTQNCTIKANAKSTLSGITVQIPILKLIGIAGDVVNSIITGGDFSALLNDMKVAATVLINNSFVYDFDLALGASKNLDMATGGNKKLLGLGLAASSPRKIYPLSTYGHLIPARSNLLNRNLFYSSDTTIDNTVDYMRKVISRYYTDTQELSKALKSTSIRDTCRRIFNFVYTHIQYQLDESGVEQVRRPLRTLYDQKGDCDCYAVLVGSILKNLNIPFVIRTAAYKAERGMQHVYIVVPHEYGEYVIDPVMDEPFVEHPYINKKDYTL